MKSMIRTMCSKCGDRIVFGNRNGIPNGIGFVLEDGTLINMCQKCICSLGEMSKEEKDAFFEEIKSKTGENAETEV